MKSIAIVIPCFNEEQRFLKNEFLTFYDKSTCCFCFVNDGSEDNTINVLKEIQKGREERVFIIDREENKGKAESVREGILFLHHMRSFEWIGFFDADFATPLTESDRLMETTSQNDDVLLVFGCRFKHLGANIERSYHRFFLGRIFATCVSLILRLEIYDSQCGAKLFNQKVINDIFTEPFYSKWLFDVEILFRVISEYGLERTKNIVVECPLGKWKEIKGSKLRFSDYANIPFNLLKTHMFYKKRCR